MKYVAVEVAIQVVGAFDLALPFSTNLRLKECNCDHL